jgi:ubiquinone/menaquinone biosynthesis C-methylase UbiE
MENILNLGAGEGDLNPSIQNYCKNLYAVDINKRDVEFGKAAHQSVKYSVQDATNLSFQDDFFQCVVCMEVLEHVNDEKKLLSEIHRILKPGGYAILTFPSQNFPFTYDPVNFLLKVFKINLPIGAYAFGHTKSPNQSQFEDMALIINFKIIEYSFLSFFLAGLLEMYWVGFVQSIFKFNAKNIKQENKDNSIFSIRPKFQKSDKKRLTDLIVSTDDFLFSSISNKSIGLGYLLQKS